MKYYAGIGSRSTPKESMTVMTLLAQTMQKQGYVLRSGGAGGADSAFEAGVTDPALKEIYLPWENFNGNSSPLYTPTKRAFELAEQYHPVWNRLSAAAKKLMARNVHQVLGADCETPVDFIVCWTPGGKGEGGTGQALRIAKHRFIPICDLGRFDLDVVDKFVKENAK